MKIALIMLAAGNSTRFSSNKLLFPVEGIPMYRRTLDCLKTVCETCSASAKERSREEIEGDGGKASKIPLWLPELELTLTVVTQYEEIAEEAWKMGAKVLWNDHPEEGISSSVKLGLKANLCQDACLFSVSDQPWLTAGTVGNLIAYFVRSKKGIACVAHAGRRGNPCIFSRKYYPELERLAGDRGGKAVARAHPGDTAVWETQDGRELMDLDAPRDAEEILG